MLQQARGVTLPTNKPRSERTLGLAALSRASMDPQTAQALWEALRDQIDGEDQNGVLLDLGTLLIATGQREKGLELQTAAIALQPFYVRPAAAAPPKLRLLALMQPGDFMANTPLDFLLEGSGVELIQYYLDGPPDPALAPEHDVAFLAVGESPEAQALLAQLGPSLRAWPRPVLNARPEVTAGLTREGVCARLAGRPGLLSPPVRRIARAELALIAAGLAQPSSLGAGYGFPFIVRPIGTHAGCGMEKVESAAELAAYLAGEAAEAFHATVFVDYSGADGLYRKYRIVFIQGRPFISHLAVSPRWMVHYLNADMAGNAANRAEEAQAMAGFDDGFARRHAEAIESLCEAIPLDYFGVDCAETPDGRLLIFEADVAMIVHAMDPADLYPYKPPAMAKLFAAFVAMLERTAQSAPACALGDVA
jgi:hypothetical protein